MNVKSDNSEISIRKITSSCDLKTVERLAGEIFPETYKNILSPEQIKYMMEMMYSGSVLEKEFSENMHFALICEGEKAAGYVSWHKFDCDGSVSIKLEKLYLSFPYHGRSIGLMALNFVKDEAAHNGCDAVYLNVNKYNLRAQKAYRRAGFEVWREEKNPIGNGYFMDDFVMKCPVSSSQAE